MTPHTNPLSGYRPAPFSFAQMMNMHAQAIDNQSHAPQAIKRSFKDTNSIGAKRAEEARQAVYAYLKGRRASIPEMERELMIKRSSLKNYVLALEQQGLIIRKGRVSYSMIYVRADDDACQ